jgi:hypothetical protein
MFHCRKSMRVFRAMDLLAALDSNLVFPPHKLSSLASPWRTRQRTLMPSILSRSGNASHPGQIRHRSLDLSTWRLIPIMVTYKPPHDLQQRQLMIPNYIVLIGETDAATGHGIIPVVKLADFGLARDISAAAIWSRYGRFGNCESIRSTSC